MGLASSQARLLLLTSRKSDLEYKSQIISQRKIMLSMQTESISSAYTQAMSNTRLMMSYASSANENKKMTEQLSYAGLAYGESASTLGKFVITDSQGVLQLPKNSTGTGVELPDWLKAMNSANPKTADISSLKFNSATGSYSGTIKIKVGSSGNDAVDWQSYAFASNDMLNNKMAFQDSLQNGTLLLKKFDTEADDTDNGSAFKTQAISGSTFIDSELYTEDDAAAQAAYETASRKVQNQDKILDLELKNIETQHKAIETEYDSVKQVIQKNIETSYKIFANG